MRFSTVEPAPDGRLFEIEASSELGATDSWCTIVSKNGGNSWNGPSVVTVGALQPASIVRVQSFHFPFSSL